MVGARFHSVEVGRCRQREEARITHVVLDERCRHQYDSCSA